MRKILYIPFILVNCISALSQPLQFQQEQYPFPVTFNGIEPQLGFMLAGRYYHHDFGDLDNDGDFDLVISKNNLDVSYIENIGTTQQAEFQFITNQIVPNLLISSEGYHAPCWCDIDNDGDLDLFFIFNCAIRYYENIGTPDSAEFILDTVNFLNISFPSNCSIDFIDIDDDDDFDIFVGIGAGATYGRIWFYRNNGTPEVPTFTLATNNFENINVGNTSSPEFCDIDADGDYDLFVGCDDGTIWYYENIGDSANYDFQYVTDNYFNIDVGGWSVPRFVDIDDDGDYDLFVGNESFGYTNNIEGDIVFFENIGNAIDPIFQLVTAQYLFPDLSATSSPSVLDIDGDGLQELLVGTISGAIRLFENNGTVEEPSFYLSDSVCFNMYFPYQPRMAFGDLDSDGDLDMVTTESGFECYVKLYENIGNATHPVFTWWQTIEWSDFYSFEGIDLVDIDNDGDLDLFYAWQGCLIKYWENIGNQFEPRFQCQTTNYLPQIGAGYEANPRFVDIDHDDDFDLMIGIDASIPPPGISSRLVFLRNIGNPISAVFVHEDTLFVFNNNYGLCLRPCFSDIDNDGDDDMFVGESGGAMLFYRNMEFENSMQTTVSISISGNDVFLHWIAVEGAEEYKIYYQDIPYFTPSGIPQATVLPPSTSWTDVNALNQGKRYYRVVVQY